MIGIDEVGRGAWAGPLLVVAARLKSGEQLPSGLTDSKLLSKKQREQFSPQIMSTCDIGEGWVSNQEIDELGLTNAMKLGCKRALETISAQVDEPIMLDGTVNFLQTSPYQAVQTQAKADLNIPIVSAAAIAAKVLRDGLLATYDNEYPSYGFGAHVGYGTAAHLSSLHSYGVTPYHRLSFKPIATLVRLSTT
jgi:ribonuclease HII